MPGERTVAGTGTGAGPRAPAEVMGPAPVPEGRDEARPDRAVAGASVARGAGGRRAALAASWGPALRLGGLIWLIFTALRYVTAAVVEYQFQSDHGRLRFGLPGVLSLPFTFDSGYFAEIAGNGYFGERMSPTWRAFFPGYPLAMRATSLVLTFDVSWGRLVVAGALVSAACSLIATVVVFRLAQELAGVRAGICAALLLMVWPAATFLTAAYSESLYLAFAVGAWWNALRGRWWVAGLLCAGASLTRVNGVFLALALLVLLLVRVARRQETFRVHKVLAVGVGTFGAVAYLGYLWAMTGDLQAWQQAQAEGWGRATVAPWTALTNTVEAIGVVPDPFQRAQLIIDVAAVALCLLAAGYLVYRRYWAELTLTLLTVLVLASNTTYLSIIRNTLTIFPLFVIGGAILARRREWVTSMVLTLSGVWMIGTTALFTLTRWVG